MKKSRIITMTLAFLAVIAVGSAFTCNTSEEQKTEATPVQKESPKQTVNLFVTHGHCSTPFGGEVNNLEIKMPVRADAGNPLEDMQLSFAIDPNSFKACAGKEFTGSIQTPGLFMSENKEMLTFHSTQVYTMGVDWYQVNGKMSIKGVEKDVKFFVTGIRNPENVSPEVLILEGQLNLYDWGIDYDQIVNGKPVNLTANPTKWMHINMKIKMS